jgi:hypothetical protein
MGKLPQSTASTRPGMIPSQLREYLPWHVVSEVPPTSIYTLCVISRLVRVDLPGDCPPECAGMPMEPW